MILLLLTILWGSTPALPVDGGMTGPDGRTASSAPVAGLSAAVPSPYPLWGVTGHRVVGEIATRYLTPEARREIDRILESRSPAIASTWLDEVRSDPAYDHTRDWHWVTIPEGMAYGETDRNPAGDLIGVLERLIADLKGGNLDAARERENLKMVIHLVADLHQPLHVGTGTDQGGNDVPVFWFGEPSSLHRVWDSQMIDDSRLSFTELARSIDHVGEGQAERWQQGSVRDWAGEVMKLREQVYRLPADRRLGYRYTYRNFGFVEQQLLKAGVRLAGVLNDIWGG